MDRNLEDCRKEIRYKQKLVLCKDACRRMGLDPEKVLQNPKMISYLKTGEGENFKKVI